MGFFRRLALHTPATARVFCLCPNVDLLYTHQPLLVSSAFVRTSTCSTHTSHCSCLLPLSEYDGVLMLNDPRALQGVRGGLSDGASDR
eukprot:SAG11_NODE_2361_length_3462_cov_2.031519_3_plen_88_part_00